jgi:hypothetical protein
MVFEHLFPESLLQRKEWSAFFLAAIYSTISIIIARLLFPANSGIVSIIFVSIFLLPYFETVLKREEQQEEADKIRSFWHLLSGNADAIRTYFFLFFGIYLTYMAYAFIAPSLGLDIGTVFREQLSLESLRGGAVFSFGAFSEILFNNWWVLLACFLIALIAGDGAIFFIAWNASTWGTIFGFRAVMASAHTGQNALLALLIIVVITLPHLILEGGAYILAAIAGGVISDEIDKPSEVRKFVVYFVCAALVYALVYMIGRVLFASGSLWLHLFAIMFALGLLYMMHFVFEDKYDGVVFRYNFYLFIFAIGTFALGALIETLVLYNATPLQSIYWAAMG